MTGKRQLFAVLVLLVFALAGEVLAGQWLTRPQSVTFDTRFGFTMRPGARLVQSREGWGTYRANSYGFADDEFVPPPGSTAGVLLGDSFGQGFQVRYGQRFSEVVEREVPGVSLLNASAAGRSQIHYALFAPRFEAAFHPRFFVMQVNDADLSELEGAAAWRTALDEFHGTGAAASLASGQRERAGWSPRALLRRSSLLHLLFTRTSDLFSQERTRLTRKLTGVKADLRDVVAAPVTPRTAALADSLTGVVQAVNPNLILLYIPHIAYFSAPPHVAYPERRAFYHALAARRGVPLVDPTDAMLESYAHDHEPLHGFLDTKPGEGHLNARGHAVVGRLLAAEIARELKPAGRLNALAPARSPEVVR